MAQVYVQSPADGVVERLEAHARVKGRSLEAETRALLEETAGPSCEDLWRAVADITTRIGPLDLDTTALVRTDRDREGAPGVHVGRRAGLPLYDHIFLALAQQRDVRVATADRFADRGVSWISDLG